MTLKEFSAKYLPLPIGVSKWRRVFPTKLRNARIDKKGFFFGKDVWQLQECWEEVHAGQVIRTEWRAIERSFYGAYSD